MFTKSKIALSVAIILGAAALAVPNHAFADNNWLDADWSPKSEGSASSHRAQMNRYDNGTPYGFGSSETRQDDVSQSRKKIRGH